MAFSNWKDFFGIVSPSGSYPMAHQRTPNPVPVTPVIKIPPVTPKTKPRQTHKPQAPEKEFLRLFKQFSPWYRPWMIWRDFIFMFACSLSNPLDKVNYDERERLYLKTITKYDRRDRNIFPELMAQTVLALENNLEQDFLGRIFESLYLGDKSLGQIFTPYHICQFTAAVSIGDVANLVEEKGYISIHDPCCGAGAMLIAGVHEAKKQLEKEGLNFQNHVLVAAQDIDQTVALMCYIQLSLLGVAAYVKVGNSLTEPMNSRDTTKNYWFTPMYFTDVWAMRRFFGRL